MPNNKINFKDKALPVALIVLLVVLTIWLLSDLFPLLVNIVQHIKDENVVIAEIEGYGPKGAFILLAMQILQVVTSFFPAAAIQILAGLTFGSLYGTVICLIGYIIGNGMVFVLIRQVRKNFFLRISPSKKNKTKTGWELSFIQKAHDLTMLSFLLALIPGIPNGILPYLFSKTDIPLSKYILSISLAGIPTIFLICFAGERIANGDIMTAVGITGALLLIAGVVFLLNRRITAYLKKKQIKSGDK